jgi:hypothetical protein
MVMIRSRTLCSKSPSELTSFREISDSQGGECEDDSLLGHCAVDWQKFIDVSEVLAASIIRVMETASTHR